MRRRASARRPLPQCARSSMPNRSNSRVWSRPFGACSRPTNRCSDHAGEDGAPPSASVTDWAMETWYHPPLHDPQPEGHMASHIARRKFLATLGGAAAWPLAGRAQQPAVPVIGFLSGRFPNDSAANVTAFHRGLGEGGFFEGQNVEIDFRWAFGHYDQLSMLAADLIRRKVTVIVATGGGITSAQAAKAATGTIPIVFVAGTDPVASGLVASLNHPGGNLTGVSFLIGALTAKKLELLHELLPKVMAIGVLINPNFPDMDTQLRDAQAAAQALGMNLIVVKAGTDGELETAFTTL